MKRLLWVMLLAASAHAETRPRFGGVVEASLIGAPASADPVAAHTHAETTIDDLVFDTLYRIGLDGVVVPHLATVMPIVDEKQTTIRIPIRKGVRFHDGSGLTAQDVAQSLERVRASVKWLLPAVSSIRADGDAIELLLRAPVPDLVMLLSITQTSITKAGKVPGDKPIGSGPFTWKQIDRKKALVQLRAFDDHFAGRPYFDEITLRWYDSETGAARRFETGNAQFSARGKTAFVGTDPTFAATAIESPASLLVYIGFGRAHPEVTGQPAFRRAVDFVVGRESLGQIGSGETVVLTRSPIPSQLSPIVLDGSGRVAELDKAKVELGKIATKQKLEVLIEETRPDDREIAERVVVALGKLGVVGTIAALPAKDFADRVAKGTTDLWIGQLALPVAAQNAWWGAAFAAGNDDWPIAPLANGTLDPPKAAAAFADRMPIVPLLFRGIELWHRTDVHGVGFDGTGRPCFADMFFFGTPSKSKP